MVYSGKVLFPRTRFVQGRDIKTFMSPWSAVKHWNEVVVPIGISAKQAMERLIKANVKENENDGSKVP